jgi:hypothetical protein
MQLTRARLKHPEVRPVAGCQGPDAGKLEALATKHKKNQEAFAEAGYNNTSVLIRGFRPRPHARCAAVNRRRKSCGARPARHHQLEKSVGRLRATAFNSGMAMKAQAEVLA